ncbi:GNAT family N-acetyltransferase [candidate division TA06 bacterium]|nr:GNAT family N-acetyltransferase [candidate division TA06 bacterium]
MATEIIDRSHLSEKAWNLLLQGSPHSSFYHGLDWIDACCRGMRGYKPFFAVSVNGQGEFQAGLPFVTSVRSGIRQNLSLPFGTYGGILALADIGAGQLDAFARTAVLAMSGPLVARQNIVDFNGLIDWGLYGFEDTVLQTHIVEMGEYAQDPFHLRKRGAVQARKHGVEIRPLRNEGEISICHQIIKDRDRRLGQATRYPLELYRSIFHSISPGGRLWWRLAVRENQILGFALSFIDSKTVHYWDGASYGAQARYRPGDALYGDIFTMAAGRGIRQVNLGASPPGAEGLVGFKQAWGGRPKEYHSYLRQAGWINLLQKIKRGVTG